jgi:hypothetical protein
MIRGEMTATPTALTRPPWLPWALCALALSAAAACVVIDALDRARIHSFDDAQPSGPVLGVSFSLLGALIVSRRPENRIGWIYLLIGVLLPLQSLGALYYEHSVVAGGSPGARWAAWFQAWASLPVFPTGLALFSFLLFPTGRLPSPRWRPLAWSAVVIVAAMIVLTSVDPVPIDVGGGFPKVANPTGIHSLGSGFDTAIGFLYLAGIVLITTAIGSLVVRGRRSAPRERQQMKLLAYAAALTSAAILVVAILGFSGVAIGNSTWDVPIVLGFGIAVPVACGFAILRHGLYEIDRLISRTISYAIVTGLLVGTFLGVVVLATRVLPFSSPVAVAASTLAAAALFNPLRVRVQRVVDRRFNRARYDAEATVAAFSARARDAVDLDTIGLELVRAVEQAVAPSHASVWIRST